MTTTSADVGSPLLTEHEAALYMRIALSSFKKLVRPQVPHVRPTPGRVLFRREDLDAYIETRMQHDAQ